MEIFLNIKHFWLIYNTPKFLINKQAGLNEASLKFRDSEKVSNMWSYLPLKFDVTK